MLAEEANERAARSQMVARDATAALIVGIGLSGGRRRALGDGNFTLGTGATNTLLALLAMLGVKLIFTRGG